MAKVTSKLQLTLPKAIAERYKIRPGDDLELLPAGDTIRMAKRNAPAVSRPATIQERLQSFDLATARQRKRSSRKREPSGSSLSSQKRGWTREDLYDRGLSR
jgi:AbrB family looped-hinge helix DNA binding protein